MKLISCIPRFFLLIFILKTQSQRCLFFPDIIYRIPDDFRSRQEHQICANETKPNELERIFLKRQKCRALRALTSQPVTNNNMKHETNTADQTHASHCSCSSLQELHTFTSVSNKLHHYIRLY